MAESQNLNSSSFGQDRHGPLSLFPSKCSIDIKEYYSLELQKIKFKAKNESKVGINCESKLIIYDIEQIVNKYIVISYNYQTYVGRVTDKRL